MERRVDGLIDDLEVAAAGQLLEFDQREVGLDTGRVAIHHQTDGAGRSDHDGLGVAITGDFADRERIVPHRARERPRFLREKRRRVRDRLDAKAFVG